MSLVKVVSMLGVEGSWKDVGIETERWSNVYYASYDQVSD